MLKNRFTQILVALDGSANSRRGMNEAISLARQSEGTITGVYVMPGLPPETAEGYRKYLSERARKFMSDAKTNAGRHGIEFEEKVITSNDTVNAIANLAKTNKFGIIVIGARGQSSPRSEYLGSVSNGVLHSCRIPILVVK
ncbi:MAG TPA: universal stress protein [Nitrososphaera sp.]|nr:universal stress protein [Nitrososphaera sp.]